MDYQKLYSDILHRHTAHCVRDPEYLEAQKNAKDSSTWHSDRKCVPGAPNDIERKIDEAKDNPG